MLKRFDRDPLVFHLVRQDLPRVGNIGLCACRHLSAGQEQEAPTGGPTVTIVTRLPRRASATTWVM